MIDWGEPVRSPDFLAHTGCLINSVGVGMQVLRGTTELFISIKHLEGGFRLPVCPSTASDHPSPSPEPRTLTSRDISLAADPFWSGWPAVKSSHPVLEVPDLR